MSDSFLDVDTSNAVEPTTGEPGEHLIRLIGFNKDDQDSIIRTDKNGEKFFMPLYDLPQDISAKVFSQFIKIPDSSVMDEKDLNTAMWALDSFKTAFQVEGGIDLAELEGREAYAILGVKVDKSGEYPDSNTIKKFVQAK